MSFVYYKALSLLQSEGWNDIVSHSNCCFSVYFSYETGDGTSVQAQGVLKNAGDPEAEVQEVSGSYAYTAADGTKVQISYIANENGYQPTGEGIPETPPAIKRALEFIAANPQPQEETQRK